MPIFPKSRGNKQAEAQQTKPNPKEHDQDGPDVVVDLLSMTLGSTKYRFQDDGTWTMMMDESLRDGEDDKTLLERLKRENAELEGQNNLLEVKNQAIIHNVLNIKGRSIRKMQEEIRELKKQIENVPTRFHQEDLTAKKSKAAVKFNL